MGHAGTTGSNPGLFDVTSTGFVSRGTDPALYAFLQCSFPGWWCNDEKERLLGELARETDPSKRKAIIERIQAIFYEDVGRIKVGDIFGLDVTRKELRGDFRSVPGFFFWNAWLSSKGASTAPSEPPPSRARAKPALDQVAHRGR